MNIRAVDLEGLNRKLVLELSNGNKWALYEPGVVYSDVEKVQFFQSRTDAFTSEMKKENLATPNSSQLISVEPLHLAIVKILINEADRSNSDYYYIGDKYFEVSKGSIAGPEPLTLDDLEKMEFEKKLQSISSSEGHWPVSLSMQEIAVNVGLLRRQLDIQGYNANFFSGLEISMLNGELKHEERYFDRFDRGTVMYNLSFNTNSDGKYSLDSITGTLYSEQDINHLTINGIDTKNLEKEMLSVNWDNDGFKFIREHIPQFRELSEDSNGRLIAVQLFNNCVPLWWNRPDFISRLEDDLMIFPKMKFPGETTKIEVYEGLVAYQEISKAMNGYEIPGTQDEKSKAALIEKLVNGKECALVAPAGPDQGDEVLLSWNWLSRELSFFFKDHLKLDARQYFVKTNMTTLIPKLRVGGDNKGMSI